MKPRIYERKVATPHFLGDRYGRVNLPHLMSVLIEISGEQTAQLKTTPAESLGLRWIIIQYDIQINRMPSTYEEITVRTFAKEYNRIFSYREFEIYDEKGNLLLYVMTVFALIDGKRKLTRIPEEVITGYGSKESRRIRRMEKPDLPEMTDTINKRNYDVRYFDIDRNFHANNSMYFIWMLDALGDEFLATHDVVNGNIVFEKEIRVGETIESYFDFKVDENDNLISRHQIKVGEVTKCVGTFIWKENKVDYTKDHQQNQDE